MSARPWRFATRERVGPFVLLAPLGQGGFSEVWRATRPDWPGPVALKLLVHPEHAGQLRAEATALSRVRGPGILAVQALDLHHDPPWLALPLLEGGSLRARVPRPEDGERPDVVLALETIERVLQVLARVHREGVVHGDLKPENVLFDRHERLYLTDFGLSRRIAQRTATLSVSLSLEDARLAGTLDYMAPEQRHGEKPTQRSDVYACGVLLYELLTGRRPQGVFRLPGASDPSIPPAIDRLLACALAQEPTHRFATAGAMLAFLRAHPKEEWKVLAAAHERLRRLLAEGGLVQVTDPGVFGICTLISVGTTAFVAGKSVTGLQPELAGVAAGALLGAIATVTLYVLLLPWLRARRLALVELQGRLEAQIHVGQLWTAQVEGHDGGRQVPFAGLARVARRALGSRRRR